MLPQVVIFVKSVSRARELNKLLIECNFPAICIHRGMKQDERCATPHTFALMFPHTMGLCQSC